ncbi:YD repeat-containing protein [Lacinutrix venerupis]|uniref:hypothetical protein n=1 Tax=Lacinutrix venerupis TaxID=1486034 RepID=UPI000EAE5645|nr:hypothetical protein [Lacinutrix venerupis]RLJ69104.1 YD repeat-containing protein [Lacinutrix venerupis]
MKRKSILIITLISIFSSAFAQNVDWINAPVNPIPQGCNLNKTNLKGDVFQHNYDYYDAQGNRIFFDSEEYVTKDQYNRVISYKSPTLGTTQYKYDSKGNLVNSGGILYEYDNNNRLTKATYSNKTETYSYDKQGDIVIVLNNTYSTDGKLIHKSKAHYKNGLIVKREKTIIKNEINYSYEFDAQGNWTKRLYTDANGKPTQDPFHQVIIYSNELNNFASNIKIKRSTGAINLTGRELPYIYINDKLVTIPLYNKLKNDYIFYNPLTSSYYIAPNAYDETIPTNTTIKHKQLIRGEKNILIINGTKTRLIKEGLNSYKTSSSWNYNRVFNHVLISNEQEAYVAKNALQKVHNQTTAFPVFAIATPGSEVWYIPSKDHKNSSLYVKGKNISGFKVAGFIQGTKDYVLSINNTPTYVLSNFSSSIAEDFNKGRYFNAAVDKISSTSNTNSNTSQNKSSTTSCTSGNCADGYGTYTYESGAKIEGFFKNGKLNGYGEFVYANGDTYRGNYLEGQRDGYGIYHWKQNNLHYYGHWKDTKQHGYGYFVKNGETIEAGIYNEGKLVTNLLTDFSNGKSSGNCLGNCTNGYGSITYDQGDVYEGLFKNGKPYKAGTYMWTNGNSYMGDWDESGKINYTGQFFTSSFVYKGAFAYNGFITGLGVKLDKKTNTKSYGEFKSGKLVIDYANGHTSAATTTNNSTASKQAEEAMLNSANSLISLYYKSNSEFKKIVVKQHNNFTQKMSIDKLNKLHALFIKHLFQLDKVVAHRYLLYLPNPYARVNTSKILTELSNEERTFMREESKRFSSKYKLKEQYVPKN